MAPIVFIHRGYNKYLHISLAQAQCRNPKTKVVLLGDSQNAGLASAEHVEASRFYGSARAFEAVYQHLSSNGEEFERFCFSRWFVLLEVMKERGWHHCWHLDSDVLLYGRLPHEELQGLQAALAGSASGPVEESNPAGASGHTAFFAKEALQDFCDHVMEQYQNPEHLAVLRAAHADHAARGRAGGICDMWLLSSWSRSYPGRVGNLARLSPQWTFDENIQTPDGFAMKNGFKLLRWHQGQPHGIVAASKEEVRFASLHFQGPSKGKMARLCDRALKPRLALELWRKRRQSRAG